MNVAVTSAVTSTAIAAAGCASLVVHFERARGVGEGNGAVNAPQASLRPTGDRRRAARFP